MTDIYKMSNRYIWQGLGISFILMAAVYVFATMLKGTADASLHVLIGCCFFMVVTIVEALVWRKVANGSPENQPTFIMGVTGVRLFLALAVMLAYYLVKGREAMLPFFLVFAVFYIAQLVHHSYFFSRVTRLADDSRN